MSITQIPPRRNTYSIAQNQITVTKIPGRYPRPVVYIFPRLHEVPVAQYSLET